MFRNIFKDVVLCTESFSTLYAVWCQPEFHLARGRLIKPRIGDNEREKTESWITIYEYQSQFSFMNTTNIPVIQQGAGAITTTRSHLIPASGFLDPCMKLTLTLSHVCVHSAWCDKNISQFVLCVKWPGRLNSYFTKLKSYHKKCYLNHLLHPSSEVTPKDSHASTTNCFNFPNSVRLLFSFSWFNLTCPI